MNKFKFLFQICGYFVTREPFLNIFIDMLKKRKKWIVLTTDGPTTPQDFLQISGQVFSSHSQFKICFQNTFFQMLKHMFSNFPFPNTFENCSCDHTKWLIWKNQVRTWLGLSSNDERVTTVSRRDVRIVSTTLKRCPPSWLDWCIWHVSCIDRSPVETKIDMRPSHSSVSLIRIQKRS